MPLVVDGIQYDELTADPGAPVEGQVWYNTTDQQLKARINGVTEVLIDQTSFDAHANAVTNPHTVTLEQARTAGGTLSGAINMGGNQINNLADPSAPGDAATQSWTTGQINSKLQGLDWQESVLDKDLAVPPGSPVSGDRYIVNKTTHSIVAVNPTTEVFEVVGDITTELSATDTFVVTGSTGNNGTYTVSSVVFNSPNTEITVNEDITDATADGQIEYAQGLWNNQVNAIAEWGGSVWVFTTPTEGAAARVEDENKQYIFDGTSWGLWDATVDHGNLTGLGDDDHTIYLLISGARAMTGQLDMGNQNIANVNSVNTVIVENHSARHDPGGADALTTATASGLDAASTNTEGAAASFARSDHTHALDTATGTISTIEAGDASAEGTGAGFSRRDHQHALDTTNGAISTVEAGDAAAEGTGTGLARRDHQHAVSTAAPSTVGTANAEGASASLARADHVHDHGAQTTEGHHAVTSPTARGFYPRSNFNASVAPTANDDSGDGYGIGSRWVDVVADKEYVLVDATLASAVWVTTGASGAVASLQHKAGRVLVGSFTGNPKKATVTFSGAYPSANYAIALTAVTTSSKTYTPAVESQVAGSFVINMGTNNVADLVQVGWVTMADGESS